MDFDVLKKYGSGTSRRQGLFAIDNMLFWRIIEFNNMDADSSVSFGLKVRPWESLK